MVELLIGIVVGIVAWLLGTGYARKQIRTFDSSLNALLDAVERSLEAESKAKEEFDHIREQTLSAYQLRQKERVRKTRRGFVLLATILCFFALCVAHVFLSPVRSSLTLLSIPVFAASVFMFLAYMLGSDRYCVLQTDSASDPKTWLALIVPSVSAGGELKIIQGSMNPDPFSKEWLFRALVWVHQERGADIQILSGEPEWEKMTEDQHKRWEQYWANIMKHGLQENVRILPERPQLQFTLTNKLVRIEKDHASWVDRENKPRAAATVPNHMHLFDFVLIWLFRVRFNQLWRHATPAMQLPPFQPKV